MDEIKTYKVEWVDVDLIKLDETNPNEMDKLKMDSLRIIMKEKGMLQPIIIDQNNLMCDGEHRFVIFKEFGMKKIPCYRLDLTDVERRILRQTMNKLRGVHNPRDDIEDLIRISKEVSIQDMSKYLGLEEKNLGDYLESVNQVPESYLTLMLEEKSKLKKRFITFKLTDDQARKLIRDMEGLELREIALVPVNGILVDNIGRD